MLFVNLYVDDLIYTGNFEEMLQTFKGSMMQHFEMSDLGRMKFFLGIEVTQTTFGTHISQHKYAIEILKRFDMVDCNPVINPVVLGSKLVSNEGLKVDATMFKQMVGSLMYLTTTRPDIQYVVNLVSQFMSNPTEMHFECGEACSEIFKRNFGSWHLTGNEPHDEDDDAGDEDDADDEDDDAGGWVAGGSGGGVAGDWSGL
ncbi:uncharacterized mitochondrial protein AtMg00810-like [Helianthus annuus]|uniref:uncharacterized mitochondrial protein AtMg00810-like n=1 Tax=Helianthus annuus TaxID=4232 RepID=UPI000B8FDC74|nr:uncharacterized mitochondrial protein AtMg00810-like [Helianthus annuus]